MTKYMDRPDRTHYYMNIAKAVSERSTCIRRRYGAVIVKDDRIVSTGYNGSVSGEVNCSDTNICPRIEQNIPHGTRYETCVAIHAEQNAILSAHKEDLKGATMYIYGYDVVEEEEIPGVPCIMCIRFIKSAGIKTSNVIFKAPEDVLNILREEAKEYV